MREMTLKDLQDLSLAILNDVHDFCEANNIRYSLAYGTLIGAVRHHGFIPWDDDIDIILPRPDYEVFIKTYSSKRYKISSFQHDPDCRITYARVYDDNYTVAKTRIPWNLHEHGVWIDVFPLDGVEDDPVLFQSRYQNIVSVFNRIQLIRRALMPFSLCCSAMDYIKLLIKKVVFCNGIALPSLIKKNSRISQQIPYGSTNHCGLIVFDAYGRSGWHEIEQFSSFILKDFEQYKFRVMSGYDGFLSTVYGDYMKLPPEDKRVPKQSYIHFYWKD